MACQYFAPCEHGAESFTIDIPKVTFGRGVLHEVGERAQALGMKQVALFTDANLEDGPYVASVTQSLTNAGLSYQIFSDIRIEPDDVCVDEAAKFLISGGFDGVISVGGGSVIDVAKAAMACAKYPRSVRDYFAPPIGEGIQVPGPLSTYRMPDNIGHWLRMHFNFGITHSRIKYKICLCKSIYASRCSFNRPDLLRYPSIKSGRFNGL